MSKSVVVVQQTNHEWVDYPTFLYDRILINQENGRFTGQENGWSSRIHSCILHKTNSEEVGGDNHQYDSRDNIIRRRLRRGYPHLDKLPGILSSLD